jgi:hypothetical protein
MDIRTQAYSSFQTARNRVLVDLGIYIATVVGWGVERANNEEAVEAVDAQMRRSRNRSRQAIKLALRGVDRDKLSDQKKPRFDARLSIVTLIENITRPRKVKKLEGELVKTGQRLSIGETKDILK